MQGKAIKAVTSGVIIFLALVASSTRGGAETDAIQEKLQTVFFPYRQGTPKVTDVTPGMIIDKSNAQAATAVLPPELLDHLAAGEFSITVQETTDTPLRKEYIDASIQHYGEAALGGAELQNYVAGLPFPLLDPNDPQAGLKGGWNFRYRDRGDNVQYWPTNEHRTGSGAVERSESFYIVIQFEAGQLDRVSDHEAQKKNGVYSKRYMRMLAPADAEGQQILSVTTGNISEKKLFWRPVRFGARKQHSGGKATGIPTILGSCARLSSWKSNPRLRTPCIVVVFSISTHRHMPISTPSPTIMQASINERFFKYTFIRSLILGTTKSGCRNSPPSYPLITSRIGRLSSKRIKSCTTWTLTKTAGLA